MPTLAHPNSSPRPGRPPTISRDAVLAAGLEVARREGVEALSLRKLAGTLGVTPRALYRHVRNKEDIVVGVIDRVVSQARVTDHDVPRARRRDWLRATFGAMHRTLVDQPAVIPVLGRLLGYGPAAAVVVDEVLDVLLAAGLDRPAASRALSAMISYTVGSAALLAPGTAADAADAVVADRFEDGFELVLAGLKLA